MQKNTALSVNKIVLFLVFICGFIFASLFIFHMRQKPVSLVLSADEGLIFPVPRDIQSFHLGTMNNIPFTEADLRGHWTLLFFGFTHCAYVCPLTLDVIRHAYSELWPRFPSLQVVFVSLDPERDKPAQLAQYLHRYHKDFIGVSGKREELRKLQAHLGVFSARQEASGANYQIQHTSSVLLINPQGQWAGLLKFGLTAKQFTRALETSLSKA